MPLYPWASWIVLVFIAGIALIMATMLQMYLPIGFVAGFYAFVMVLYLLTAKSRMLAGQD
jgi:L-asparagine transporter-like permease